MAAIRLFTTARFSQQTNVTLDKQQAHYLKNVMRRKAGDSLRLFNGIDGEWEGSISLLSKSHADILLQQQVKAQSIEPKVRLCFAPVKNAPQHFLVQKATELGVSELQPVITRHTVVSRVNTEKLRANVLEAAEQCGRLSVPDVKEPLSFDAFMATRDETATLIFCDETGGGEAALNALSSLQANGFPTILIGPEGGFAAQELAAMRASKNSLAVGLGPRILRADTAALAALTLVQAVAGDWDRPPAFEAQS